MVTYVKYVHSFYQPFVDSYIPWYDTGTVDKPYYYGAIMIIHTCLSTVQKDHKIILNVRSYFLTKWMLYRWTNKYPSKESYYGSRVFILVR